MYSVFLSYNHRRTLLQPALDASRFCLNIFIRRFRLKEIFALMYFIIAMCNFFFLRLSVGLLLLRWINVIIYYYAISAYLLINVAFSVVFCHSA